MFFSVSAKNVVWLAQSDGFDIRSFFDSIGSFLRTFADEVMDDDLRGLIVYLWGCFPAYLRSFILTCVVCVLLAAFFQTFRRD